MMTFTDDLLPIQLNYGLVIIDLEDIDDYGDSPVLHFVGLSKEPDEDEMIEVLSDYLDNHPEYDKEDNTLSIQLADDDVIEIYKNEYMTWLSERN